VLTDSQQIIEVLERHRTHYIAQGECRDILAHVPPNSIDCVITSPPYWNQRDYAVEARLRSVMIGQETALSQYIENIRQVFHEIRRVLKPSGSLWLNVGDKYQTKNLVGLPWRVALALKDDGWILRNDVIWNQMKGTQSSKDRLRMIHEHIFHFVKSKDYFYDSDEILIRPLKLPSTVNGIFQSATGVSGKRYRQQIQESNELTAKEKIEANKALDMVLRDMKEGKIVDFRMTIRGRQRALHSNSKKISGRARELAEKGFYIMKSSADGYMPSDIWNIVPEDQWRTDSHCAVFPIELLQIPIKATCPKTGIVLDPFVGTGSTVAAALKLGRRGIGIDLSKKYVEVARSRLKQSAQPLSLFGQTARNM